MDNGRWRVALVVGLLVGLWAMPASTQTPPPVCASGEVRATWDANSEPDLAGYHLVVSEDGVPRPVVTFPSTAMSGLCDATTDVEYQYRLTAFDTSGNESGPSLFDLDKKPPVSPTGLTVTTTTTTTMTITIP